MRLARIAARGLALTLGLAAPVGLALAEQPEPPPSKLQHPNLRAAEKLAAQATVKLAAARDAKEHDPAGHAARAHALLEQATAEIRRAIAAAR
jgi:hypothetical protein